ncbi:MAG TPA: hypothetical protein VF650_17425 [Allosphingosinicella sp.]
MTLVLTASELFTRHAPLGFVFRDASDRSLIVEGLDVGIADSERPWRKTKLAATPSGTWTTPRLPGLGATLAGEPGDWPANRRDFDLTVEDSLGRFVPARFTAGLPARGRFAWPAWPGFNQARIRPLLPPDPPAAYEPDYLPLFPAIARAPPGPRTMVRAQLAIRQPDGSDRPAAWAAMTVSVSNRIVALGIAGASGAVVASGAYPALPSQTVAEAAAGRSEVSWEATIRVYYDALEGALPDQSEILGQLSKPSRRALLNLSPGEPQLPPQTLTLGRPLTLATMRTATERFSTLYLKAD